MNFGTLTGYSTSYKIIGTQFTTTGHCNSNAAVTSDYGEGIFIAPSEAVLALVSGCARGGHANSQSGVGGGGAGACFRIPFPLSNTFRYVPFRQASGIGTTVIGCPVGGYALGGTSSNGGVNYEGMPSIVLTEGGIGTSVGGAGGGATYGYYHSGTYNVSVSLSGGTCTGTYGGDGKVAYVGGEGGILASGGAGSNSGGYTAGSVHAPWGTQWGGGTAAITSVGAGGASLFSFGPTINNLPMIFASTVPPGLGAGGYGSSAYMGVGFVYVEFLAPTEIVL